MYRAVLIDDEAPARDLVRHFLHSFSNIVIVGEAGNGLEGFKLVQSERPDFIILDVHMPKITGFEMISLIEDPPLVIFSTAYDEYAIKAFEQNAIDYLLKPYSQERFNKAIEKALTMLERSEKQEKIVEAVLGKDLPHYSRVVVKNGSSIDIIPFSEIELVEAKDDYVNIVSEKGTYLKKETLKNLEEILPSGEFVRVHRSYLVRTDKIAKIEPYSKDSYLAVMTSGIKASVSRQGYQLLKEMLKL